MSTPFSNIYDRFVIKVQDSGLSLSTELLTEQNLFNMLNSANANFNMDCPKDLSDYSGIEHGEDTYTGNGIQTSFLFTTTPVSGSFYVVTVDGVATTNYTYVSGTNSIDFNVAPTGEVFIQWIYGGEFTATLIGKEEEILARFMLLEWLNKEIYNICQLRNSLTPADWRRFSEASNIKAKTSLMEYTNTKLDTDVMLYTWNIGYFNGGAYYDQ